MDDPGWSEQDIETLRAVAEAYGIDVDDMTREELVEALRRAGGGGLPESEEADNAEVVLDPDLEAAEPAEEAAGHAEHLKRRTERTDTHAHPESPPKPKRPGP